MRNITYSDAIREATIQEMERDPNVFIYGIDVPDHKGIFGSTLGLQEKFGKDRVFDTPLSEDTMAGFGLGAAINGLRRRGIKVFNVTNQMIKSGSYSMVLSRTIRSLMIEGWG